MTGGGIERVTLTLIEEFQNRGVSCYLALRQCRGDFLDEARRLTEVVEIAGDGIHRFVPRLSELIRKVRPTHLITAVPDVTLLTLIARWKADSGARIIQGAHLTQARIAHPRGVGGWIRSTVERNLTRVASRYVDAIVAVSEGVDIELRNELGAPANKVFLIHNPIVREVAARIDESSVLKKELRFIAIGRLSRQKGFDLLVRALAGVKGGWRLDVYGAGPELDALTSLVEDCGLHGRIEFRGHTDDPNAALDAADWLIMPSRYEGFGLVLVEAMARGVPVISSDCPHGPGEIVDNGRFGVLVPAGDSAALAATLREVMAGQHRFDGELLRQRAVDFSVTTSVDKWLQLLQATGDSDIAS